MVNIHLGQNWDIYWHNNGGNMTPTEMQYFQMVINKTSVLPRMCIRIISTLLGEDVVSPQQRDSMVHYTESLGVAFQIQDDLISILSESYAESRGILAEDIHEGKKTLMVINALNGDRITGKQKSRLQDILNMGTDDENIIREAISILKDSGSIEYASQMAKEII